MTAVWEATALPLRAQGEKSPLSKPIIPALNISKENSVKFKLKEQSIQEDEQLKQQKATCHAYEEIRQS